MADERELLEIIAGNSRGILAAVRREGYPHLTNVLYVWDSQERIARVSTTADRVKGRILQRDPHAALHVSGPHFWSYAVAECDAQTSDVAATPGDEASRELLEVHAAFSADVNEDAAFSRLIEERRLVVRLRVRRLYGVVMASPPGG
jgi:PPOX class probable F420-dependent enzyme